MLKRKKQNTQTEWMNAYKEIVEYMKEPQGMKEAEELIQKAISRIPKGKCVYGWSGGKDALALQVICEAAGITDCVLGTIGERWEYQVFPEFVKNHAPDGLKIIDFGVTAEFLNEHPNLVLPATAKDNYYWYKFCNQRAYMRFADEMDADWILLGLRTQDGNKCHGRRDKRQISPMHDFTHEDIFKIMAYGNKPLPPMYHLPDGFNQGTHAWIMRHGGDKELETLWKIDMNIILRNQDVDKVRKFLEAKKV